MDFYKINSVMARALSHFDEQENIRMSEVLFEEGGVLELPDNAPMGDPDVGGSHGTDNHDSWVDVYMSFISGILDRCMSEYSASEEDATKYFMDFADQLYEAGELPEMPDPDASEEDKVLGWISAAKNVGFEKRLMDYVGSMMGGTAPTA